VSLPGSSSNRRLRPRPAVLSHSDRMPQTGPAGANHV